MEMTVAGNALHTIMPGIKLITIYKCPNGNTFQVDVYVLDTGSHELQRHCHKSLEFGSDRPCGIA